MGGKELGWGFKEKEFSGPLNAFGVMWAMYSTDIMTNLLRLADQMSHDCGRFAFSGLVIRRQEARTRLVKLRYCLQSIQV
eukprot:6184380-Pleurochrysis_carterae.AAC.3